MEAGNDLELKKETEESRLHRMAMVGDFLESSQGSQNLLAIQEESRAQNLPIKVIGYISDTKEIIGACCSLFQYDGAATFTLSERSPLPPALSAQDLPGGQTKVLNVHRIRTIDPHPVKTDEDSTPESISDTENWLN